MKLRGKVALVTGGARRIGRALAVALAERGCRVAITYRASSREAASAVREIERSGTEGFAVRADQRDPQQVKAAVRSVLRRFGQVDILVNNASSFYPTHLETTTPAQWNDLIGSNLAGPFWFSQALGPLMKRSGSGKILNLADVSFLSPWTDTLPYCAAKGGVVTLTLGLAKALAPQVQVNAIAPGPILFPADVTPGERRRAVQRTLLKRVGSPEDIVAAALFFLEGSDFVTGVILPVDGGRRLA